MLNFLRPNAEAAPAGSHRGFGLPDRLGKFHATVGVDPGDRRRPKPLVCDTQGLPPGHPAPGPVRRWKRRIGVAAAVVLLLSPTSSREQPAVSDPPVRPASVTRSHEYSTVFARAENPISEGRAWINGGTVGLDWADVATESGRAIGANLPGKYADPTAVLAGSWQPTQRAEARVRVKTTLTRCCREVELRLRTVIGAHRITGYEILCSVVGSFPYIAIVRWNGPINDFTELGKAEQSCADNDLLAAVAHGDTIAAYRNGTKVLEVKDGSFREGSPGIGFYDYRDDVWMELGVTSWIRSKLGLAAWHEFGFDRFSATDTPDEFCCKPRARPERLEE